MSLNIFALFLLVVMLIDADDSPSSSAIISQNAFLGIAFVLMSFFGGWACRS